LSTSFTSLLKSADKEEKYLFLIPQLKSLLKGEEDFVARLSTAMAVLKEAFDFLWVGTYMVNDRNLIVGPFQGPVACLRIPFGKGVCGKSWELKEAIIVPDVDQFPGHIACSSLSRSEIVVPAFGENEEVVFLIDVDSRELNAFDLIDLKYLNQLVEIIIEKN